MKSNVIGLTLLLALVAIGNGARATEADIPRLEAKVCPHNYKNDRTYWDVEKQFCYELDGKRYAYPLSGMGEIKLRDGGEWIDTDYVNALSPENREVVSKYDKYYVRYLALGPIQNSVEPFVVHVFFKYGTGTQTMYVFGQRTPTGVVLTGYSNSQGFESNLRAIWGSVSNLLNNPGVRSEDVKRIRPSADVVDHYFKKSQPPTIQELPRP